MIESFVDLTYRGLPLGRRVKLTQVRPSTGYLEVPAPMPVGTAIAIATDEGVMLEAVVTSIHEQVGGSDRPPGMTVKPALADDTAQTWWKARVALPEEEAAPAPRGRPLTVRPRTHTVPQPPPVEAIAPAPAARAIDPEPPGSKTTVMNAIDQDLLEQLTRPSGGIEQLVRATGEHDVVDDGRSTIVMEAVDPAALELLDAGSSGPLSAADDEDTVIGGDDKKLTSGGTVKKRKKRR